MRHECSGALVIADGSLIVIVGGNAEETTLETEVLDYSDPNPSEWNKIHYLRKIVLLHSCLINII